MLKAIQEEFMALRPFPGSAPSPGPWQARGDGTIVAADGQTVCVLGCPDEEIEEQDVTNGAAILALPQLLSALRRLRGVRPVDWSDGDDPELQLAWQEAEDALALAAVDLAEDQG